MRHAQLAAPWNLGVSVGLALAMQAAVCGQPPLDEVQPPHVLVQHHRANQAELLTEQRTWPLEGGTSFSGSLCRWYIPDGLVLMHNPQGRPSLIPLRQFEEPLEEEIRTLLAPHAEQMQRVLATPRVPVQRPWERIIASLPSHAAPAEVTETDVLWKWGQGCFRTPVTALDPIVLKAIRQSIEARDQWSYWETAVPGKEFAGELVGQTETAFMFRDLFDLGVRPTGSDLLVAKSMLGDEARARAAERLAALPDGGMLPDGQLPPWWCWLESSGLNGPGNPLELAGDKLKLEFPQPQTLQHLPPPAQGVRELRRMFPTAQLEFRLLLAEREYKAAHESLSVNELSAWRSQKRAEIVADDPLLYLSPHTQWRLRDQDSNAFQQAILMGERDGHWIFGYGDPRIPAALPKEELAAGMRELATQTVRRLEEYFASHPEAARPALEGSYRIVRTSAGQAEALEPVALQEHGAIEFRTLPRDGATETRSLHPTFLHFLDAHTVSLVLAGQPVGSEAERALPLVPAGPQRWLLVDTNVVLSAELEGQYQDSLVLRQGEISFLLDRDVLSTESAEQADQFLAIMRQRSGKEPTRDPADAPELRLWCMAGPVFVGPGKNVRFNARGDLQFVDAQQENRLLQGALLPSAVVVEVRTQIEADEIRKQARDPHDPHLLEELAKFKQATRTRLKKELEVLAPFDPGMLAESNPSRPANGESPAPRRFKLSESAFLIQGHFVQFEGEDAIFRDSNGVFFRVYRFQLAPDTLAELEAMTAGSRARQLPYPAPKINAQEVTARWLRAARPDGFLIPATPVAFDGQHIYFRSPSGGSLKHATSALHPRDVDELRGELYRKSIHLKRDEKIDERLRQPVAPEDVVTEPVTPTGHWLRQLEILRAPRKSAWETRQIPLRAGEHLLSLSPDGARILIGGGEHLRLADSRGGTRKELEVEFNPERPLLLGKDEKDLVGFAADALVQWDVTTGEIAIRYGEMPAAPVATAVSADGSHLFLLMPAGEVRIIQPEARTQVTVQLPEGAEPPEQIACSAEGSHFVLVSRQHIEIFAWDEDSGAYQRHLQTKLDTHRPLVALSPYYCVLAEPGRPGLLIVDISTGQPASATYVTGLEPAWIAMEANEEFPSVQVIGQRVDVPADGVARSFTATVGLNLTRIGTPQVLEHVLTPASLVASSGDVIVHQLERHCQVWRRRNVPSSTLQPLSRIAKELVDKQDVGQMEAVWTYLRTETFHPLGAYPEHAAETFLDYLNAHLKRYGWMHGGDLLQRAELLLDRWATMAPNSDFVPLLQAIYWRDMAWRARGTGVAATVTEQQSDLFAQRMRKAAELLKPILQSEQPPARVYSLGFEVSMSLNLPLDTSWAMARSLMKKPTRTSVSPHRAMALLLLPRWHGQSGDSEKYITAVSDSVGGTEGDAMYAQLMLHAASFYPENLPVSNFLDVDLDRLLTGLRVYYRKPQSDALLSQSLGIFAQEQRLDLYLEAMELASERNILPEYGSNKAWQQHEIRMKRALAPEGQRAPARDGAAGPTS